jgi:DNA-binding beta-propeller fold protein YncE
MRTVKISVCLAGMFLLLACISFSGCKKDEPAVDLQSGGFPNEIGKLILGNCATTGCHDDVSKEAAGGLSLSSWDKMFEGGKGGAVVVPYRSDFSTLFYYVNTHEDLGISMQPTMPYGAPPLSRENIIMLKDWINNGAPAGDGRIKWSDNPFRKKYYVANQGCDEVGIFDQGSDLAMRYIKVGNFPQIESAHMIKVSPDGSYWYVLFLTGSTGQNFMQKFRTSDNSLVGQANLGPGYWNTFAITSDGKAAYAIDWSGNGGPIYVNLQNMTVISNAQNTCIYPHGSAISGGYLYISMQQGNGIYKMDTTDFGNYTKISLDPPNIVNEGSNDLNIHEIAFSPDGSKYFVTCQGQLSNEVRIVKTSNDSLLAIIPVGKFPSEIAVSTYLPYIFVSCPEDTTTFPGKRGTVAVINYNTQQLIKKIYTGHQPHGIAVNDDLKKVYVANRNATSGGPAPHHSSVCGGRNGNVTIIDMFTLELIPGRNTEVSADPYSVGSMR